MKNMQRKMICTILGALLCLSLSGCTVGEYAVCDFYTDGNGDLHFMMFGKHNMEESTDIDTMPEIESTTADDSMPEIESTTADDSMPEIESTTADDSMPEIESITTDDSMPEIESTAADDSAGITATTLKSGWTSSDPSILKGTNVSVQRDHILFSINMVQEKEVTVSYDILLSDGAYQLIYISPDGTEHLLTDEQTARSDEQLKLAQGVNEIVMASDDAVFQKIDITIAGIEVSDFN